MFCTYYYCLFDGYGLVIDGLHKKGRFSTSCTVNVAHAFASGMRAGFLLFCLCVVRCDAGAVFAFFSASIVVVHLSVHVHFNLDSVRQSAQ